MRIPRVHIEAELKAGQSLVVPAAQGHYLSRVLRLGPGSPVVLFNGDGCDYAGQITAVSDAGVAVRTDTRLPAVLPSPLALTLVQAISRGERMDHTLQKATELGVRAFQPVFSARCEVRLAGERLTSRIAHWRKVVLSACEQSGRADVPDIHSPVTLAVWVARPGAGQRLVLDPAANHPLGALALTDDLEVLVGPEGGLDETEIALLTRSGVRAVSLGPRVLRTETAGPAAIAVLQALGGDMA